MVSSLLNTTIAGMASDEPPDSTGSTGDSHRFELAGVRIRVESDVPLSAENIHPKLQEFRVGSNGQPDDIAIHHHFGALDVDGVDLGDLVYHRVPWSVSRRGDAWVYLGILPEGFAQTLHRVMVWNAAHTVGHIFHSEERRTSFIRHGITSLTGLPTDQILLAPVLADHQACLLHSAGSILHGRGLAFVGRSGAGKSTMLKLIGSRGKILCDDRNVVRRWPEGFRIHGTWSHGELPDVSSDSAPLHAVFFLEQATENRVERITEPSLLLAALVPRVIKSLATADWWEKILDLAGRLAHEVPCYRLRFDKSGRIVDLLEEFCQETGS